MPYRAWSIEPVGELSAVFSLRTQRFNVKISVQEAGVRLLSPDLPELSRQCTVVMRPAQLLLELAAAGLNIMPLDTDIPLVEDNRFRLPAKVCCGSPTTGGFWGGGGGGR
jgi:hypothetical protein